jgi:hypothetical protein
MVRLRILAVLGAAILGCVAALPARAETVALAAFFGSFAGSGIAETYDNVYAPETVRDLDVVIGPAGTGFSVAWTTVVRKPGRAAKRKAQTLVFEATGTGTRYRCKDFTDPYGDGLIWAGRNEQTLSVFILNIDQAGGYQLQRYARTLTSLGMELVYTRKIDGENLRVVKARLVRNK